MAKQIQNRNIQQKQIMNSELIISKTDLNQKLQERILIGDELFDRVVNTNEDFLKLQSDYSNWNDYNSEYLKQSFNFPANEYKIDYDNTGKYIGLYDLTSSFSQYLNNLKLRISGKYNNLQKLVTKSELLKSSIVEIKKVENTRNELNRNEVFIVHGHDEEAQSKTARFIEKLGFKPIILNEQTSSSKTIIEKIEAYSNVGFGVILYTPCDIGAKKEKSPNLKSRARQNVVFEHGFLIGKIGRENVCALIKDDVETPNDISGVVYTKMDNENAWQFKLAKELKKSGYDVDLNKL